MSVCAGKIPVEYVYDMPCSQNICRNRSEEGYVCTLNRDHGEWHAAETQYGRVIKKWK